MFPGGRPDKIRLWRKATISLFSVFQDSGARRCPYCAFRAGRPDKRRSVRQNVSLAENPEIPAFRNRTAGRDRPSFPGIRKICSHPQLARRLERTDKSVGLFIIFSYLSFLYYHQFRQAVPESLCVSRIRCVNINFSISVSYMVLRLSQKQCLRQSGTRHIFVFSDRFPVSDVPVDRRS